MVEQMVAVLVALMAEKTGHQLAAYSVASKELTTVERWAKKTAVAMAASSVDRMAAATVY